MKTLIFSILAIGTLSMSACKENKEKTSNTTMQHDMNGMKDGETMNEMPMNANMTIVTAKKSPVNLDELTSIYMKLTSALANDDDGQAASVAKDMVQSLAKIDQSSFSTEQKKGFADIVADLKEHAEHIGENAGNIEHQREHLDLLSADFYDLVKDFGTSKPVYKVFCPMYNESKGAFWLSNSAEVKNPYYGKDMLSCGEVQEEIK
jgi:hypothetical protein